MICSVFHDNNMNNELLQSSDKCISAQCYSATHLISLNNGILCSVWLMKWDLTLYDWLPLK